MQQICTGSRKQPELFIKSDALRLTVTTLGGILRLIDEAIKPSALCLVAIKESIPNLRILGNAMRRVKNKIKSTIMPCLNLWFVHTLNSVSSPLPFISEEYSTAGSMEKCSTGHQRSVMASTWWMTWSGLAEERCDRSVKSRVAWRELDCFHLPT